MSRVNRLFVLLFENNAIRTSYKRYFLTILEIKDYKVITKPCLTNQYKWSKTYENNRMAGTGQGDNYTTDILLHYPYFKEHYKLIAIDTSK